MGRKENANVHVQTIDLVAVEQTNSRATVKELQFDLERCARARSPVVASSASCLQAWSERQHRDQANEDGRRRKAAQTIKCTQDRQRLRHNDCWWRVAFASFTTMTEHRSCQEDRWLGFPSLLWDVSPSYLSRHGARTRLDTYMPLSWKHLHHVTSPCLTKLGVRWLQRFANLQTAVISVSASSRSRVLLSTSACACRCRLFSDNNYTEKTSMNLPFGSLRWDFQGVHIIFVLCIVVTLPEKGAPLLI